MLSKDCKSHSSDSVLRGISSDTVRLVLYRLLQGSMYGDRAVGMKDKRQSQEAALTMQTTIMAGKVERYRKVKFRGVLQQDFSELEMIQR